MLLKRVARSKTNNRQVISDLIIIVALYANNRCSGGKGYKKFYLTAAADD